jgi:RNA polymerase sigma-70 factor, ECF subfamily
VADRSPNTTARYSPAITTVADDRELVSAAQAGDRGAMDALLRRHYDRIFALCRRITGSEADGADAAQEALIAVVRGLPRFDGRAQFSTWAYRVTTNVCLDELRRQRRRPVPGLGGSDWSGGQSAAADPIDDVPLLDEQVGDRLDIDAALAQLPPDFRAAVVLRDVCQLDYAEIGQVLGIPPGTVRSRIARGRAAVAARLAGNPDPPTQRPTG